MSTSQPGGHDEGWRSRCHPDRALVADQILAFIAEQGLQRGDHLPPEQDLREILHTDQRAIREALDLLSTLGRIKVQEGAGLVVWDSLGMGHASATLFRPGDMEHVAMLFGYRLSIESEAAKRAASSASPAEVRTIKQTAERSLDAALNGDFGRFQTVSEEFHRAVGSASHNIFLSSAVDQIIQLQCQVLVIGLGGTFSGSMTAAAEQHIEIAQAIGAGDASMARAAAGRHILMASSQVQDRINAMPGETPPL